MSNVSVQTNHPYTREVTRPSRHLPHPRLGSFLRLRVDTTVSTLALVPQPAAPLYRDRMVKADFAAGSLKRMVEEKEERKGKGEPRRREPSNEKV
jgi:hypothetical protein